MSFDVSKLDFITDSGIYKSFFEHHPDVVCIVDRNGTYVDANPACFTILGYSRAEFLQRPFSSHIMPEQLEETNRCFRRCLDGETVRYEVNVLHKEGRWVTFDVTNIPVIANGEVTGVFGIGRDVTERKQTEQALIESKERYESLKKYNPNGICSLDLHGHVIGANPAFERLTGYSLDELRKLDAHDAGVYPEELVVHQANLGRGNNFLDNVETKIRHKSGRDIHVLATSVPIIVSGKTIGTYMILQDKTEIVSAQQRLHWSEERYRLLVDTALDSIGIIEDGIWTFINPAGCKMFGASCPSEIIGKRHIDLLHQDHHEECKLRTKQILNGESLQFVEQKFIKLDGSVFHVDVVGVNIGRNAIQVLMRDLTERKKTEEFIVQSEKLSAVGQLAAGVAHEIRNPLTALQGFAQILQTNPEDPNRRYIEIMKSELNRIEVILNEMLVLARPQSAVFKHHSLQNLLQEVVTLLSTEAMMRNVLINTDFVPNLPLVNCDESQLKQVFLNVIKNGIEAMPDGGKLVVASRAHGGDIRVSCVDEGVGIPADRIPKLGEPFFTTKEQGTGLGLMVSHKIITAHKGHINIFSEVGKGTTVEITLPAVHNQP